MRVFLVALLAAFSLGGVLRLSRSPAPAPQPLAAIAAPTPVSLAPARAPAREEVRPKVAVADELPTASIPPEQPRLLKARTAHRKAVPIPQPPQRVKAVRQERIKKHPTREVQLRKR